MCLLKGFINFWSTKCPTPSASVCFNFHGFSRFLSYEQNSLKLIKNLYVFQLRSYIYCSNLINSSIWMKIISPSQVSTYIHQNGSQYARLIKSLIFMTSLY